MSLMEDGIDNSPSGAVENDPERRYWRFEDVLGRGAVKTVFKAFDSREGIEVAWNKVLLESAVNEDPIGKRLFSEIRVLKRLKHKNIMTFHDYWLDKKTNTFNFITELFTHGSLKRFRATHKHLELKVLKKWAWQILQGLVYLHGHEPPIIHRDLKCDNIFINGVTGDLKIGDLGLATLRKEMAPLSVIGTPEFMAPEVYDEKYNEKVDVYAFGMLLLEIVSMDYPYSECTNPLAIYKKVSHGVYPASIQKITNEELKGFIEICIAHKPSERPEARRLLKHPFFDSIKEERGHERQQSFEMGAGTLTRSGDCCLSIEESARIEKLSRRSSQENYESSSQCVAGADCGDFPSIATSDGVKIRIGCKKDESEPILHFELTIAKPGGVPKTIEFPFDINADTAEAVVDEMREEGQVDWNILITEEEAAVIGDLIAAEVEKWRRADHGDLTAYLSVTRKACEVLSETGNDVENHCPLEACEELESKMGDMCQMVASNPDSDQVFQAMNETTIPLWTIMKSDSKHNRCMHASDGTDDEFYSDGILTQPNVIIFKAFDHLCPVGDADVASRERHEEHVEANSIDDDPSSKCWIPAHGSSKISQSVSMTMSDPRVQHDDSTSKGSGCAHTRHLSIRRGSPKWSAITQQRQSYIKALSMTTNIEFSSTDMLVAGRSPKTPVAFSAFMVGPSTPTETPQREAIEGAMETVSGADTRHASLISFVSTTKATLKKEEETTHSAPAVDDVQRPIQKSRRKPDLTDARSKVDNWQWTLANCLLTGEEVSHTSQRNSAIDRIDSDEKIVQDAPSSHQISQELDSWNRSEAKAPTVMRLSPDLPSTVRGIDSEPLSHADEIPAQHMPFQSNTAGDGMPRSAGSTHSSPFDISTHLIPYSASPRIAARPVSDLGENSATQLTTIKAFRREEGPEFEPESDSKPESDGTIHSGADLAGLLQKVNHSPRPSLTPSRPINPGILLPPSSSDTQHNPAPSERVGTAFHRSRSGTLMHRINSRMCTKLRMSVEGTGRVELPAKEFPKRDASASENRTQDIDFMAGMDSRKEEVILEKQRLRQRASENIYKMQEQQLAGLCSQSALGVASGRPIGNGKSDGTSTKGGTSNG